MRGHAQTRLSALYRQAMKVRTYFGLVSCETLCEPCGQNALTQKSQVQAVLVNIAIFKMGNPVEKIWEAFFFFFK